MEDPPLESKLENSIDIESILILERSLAQSGQKWIENINIIEHLLVKTVESLNSKSGGKWETCYILRRMPTYMTSYVNTNEYAVVLKNLDFTLTSPEEAKRRASSTETLVVSNYGNCEIYLPVKEPGIVFAKCGEKEDATKNDESEEEKVKNHFDNLISSNNAYLSHAFFKEFVTDFIDVSTGLIEELNTESITLHCADIVQIIGPHLLQNLKCNNEVSKIFTLVQPNVPLRGIQLSQYQVNVDEEKTCISVSYLDTRVSIRPCLFQSNGFPRVNTTILERIPLYHPFILNISEALCKGSLLFPTTMETMWSYQFWPSESHLTSYFHPSSIVARIFKMYGTFCLNPMHFFERLSENRLIGIDNMESFESKCINLLSVDFFISSFLYELEQYGKIEDFAPRNFDKRFKNLITIAVDAHEKGFHSHYFTKSNILRGIWKNSDAGLSKSASINCDLDDIEESTEFTEKTEEYRENGIHDSDDDFGFHFDALTVNDEDLPDQITTEYMIRQMKVIQAKENGDKNERGNKERKRRPSTLSKVFSSDLIRRFSNKLARSKSDVGVSPSTETLSGENSKSELDVTSEQSVSQMRREQQAFDPKMFAAKSRDLDKEEETSFVELKRIRRHDDLAIAGPSSKMNACSSYLYENEGFHTDSLLDCAATDSIYSNILEVLNMMSPCDILSEPDLLHYLEESRKILESQEELIDAWVNVMNETPQLKYICPHAFTPRQVKYISIVIQNLAKCSPNVMKASQLNPSMSTWEISGDILRIVLYQMRSDFTQRESVKQKQRPARRFSLKAISQSAQVSAAARRVKSLKFSFRKSEVELCKAHGPVPGEMDKEGVASAFAMEDFGSASTYRLLLWLWQLRNSEIGRLSSQAKRYFDELHRMSLINSHFLEQFTERHLFENMALRSAVAVSRIMTHEKYPVHIPLLAASRKGWQWAEMIMSLASWNNEKGLTMKAVIPDESIGSVTSDTLSLDLNVTNADMETTPVRKRSSDPDTDALTLAFHSDVATPLGWNDFEDPRRPGPYTVPILILSSISYFKGWEMIPGNIVQVLVRLQKFSSLQHVGAMLFQPHRKTALHEIRKLNKTLSFRSFHFEDNVMSKTFKRIASQRASKRGANKKAWKTSRSIHFYSCEQLGCAPDSEREEALTTVITRGDIQIECTRL